MKLERTKNAIRNMIFGIVLKVYQMIMPFIMRTVMIYLLGVQYLGLNSLFTSVLQVLNLAELGVGGALVFSMYKPIAENKSDIICALMRLYRFYYRIIGLVILALGLCLLPFIPNLIHGDVPSDVNVYVLYLLNLFATVLTYWLFAYKNSILQAFQRVDVVSKVTLGTETVKYALQIVALAVFHDYYMYVIIILATQILANIVTAIVSDRMYPQYKPQGKLGKGQVRDINKRIRDLFTSKIGYVALNSSSSLIISAFLGLTALAVFQNYFYLVTAVIGIIGIVFQSVMAGVGNSLITETSDKNFADCKVFTMLMCWMLTVCSACFLVLFQPFMIVWVGKDLLLDFGSVLLFCIYFFIYEINQLLCLYKDAAGLWHQDRFRPLVTAMASVVLGIVFVKSGIGVAGILLGSVLSMLVIGMPWLLHNIFTTIFERRFAKSYTIMLLIYTAIAVIVCAVCYGVCMVIPVHGMTSVIIYLVIAVMVSNVLIVLVYSRIDSFKSCLGLLNRITRRKIPGLNTVQ